MGLKLHFLHSYLHHIRENLGALSEEQGEKYSQDIEEMERRYEGWWNVSVMAD